jgi:hypothetical protein
MKIRMSFAAASCLLLAGFTGSASAHKTHLDDGLFTTYSMGGNGSSISFSVCGSLAQSEGCYGGGTLSPFEAACAVLESAPKYKLNVVTREIYVLDKRTSASDPALLYVYKRNDTITDTFDTIQVSPKKKISLQTTGGSAAHCSLAANDPLVYVGTDASTTAVSVDKKSFAVTVLPGFSPATTVSSITADDRGYIALHYGNGFYLFGPNGALQEDGGGAADLVNTRNGWKPN